MNLKRQHVLWGAFICLLIWGCNVANQPPEEPPAGNRLSGNALDLLGEEIPDPTDTPLPSTPTLAPTDTPPPTTPPTATPPPTATVPPTPTPVPTPAFIACCRGNHVYQLTEAGPERIELTTAIGNYYDFHPDTGRLLYGSAFPNRGLGPGNKAVTDLYILDVATEATTVVFPEDVIVNARWSPNGEDFAYLMATDTTYELHVRLASGEDRLMATDVYLDYAFDPAGTSLAFVRKFSEEFGLDSSLHTVSIATGIEQKIGEIDKSGGGSIDDQIIWWPDGSAFSIPFLNGLEGTNGIAHISLASEVTPLTFSEDVEDLSASGIQTAFVLWHPAGDKIIGFSFQEGPYVTEFTPHIALYQLDETHTRIIDRTILFEGLPNRSFTWHEEGLSFWVFLQPETPGDPIPELITLPEA